MERKIIYLLVILLLSIISIILSIIHLTKKNSKGPHNPPSPTPPPPSPSPSPSSPVFGYTLSRNMDNDGDNFNAVPENSANNCAVKWCNKKLNCKGFVYDKNTEKCWLKNTIGAEKDKFNVDYYEKK